MNTIAGVIWDAGKVPCEAYLVMSNRRDGELPTIEKSDGILCHTIEEAEKKLNQWTEEVGNYYGIYRVLVVVEEKCL